MAKAVIMPRQGQSVESCIITQWDKQVGDDVNIGDVLFSCETDKASFEVESEFAGVMLAQLAEEGDDVPCLDNVCVIGQEGEDISQLVGSAQETPVVEILEAKQEAVVVDSATQAKPEIRETGEQKISPRARQIATSQNVDLTRASATGPYGRIIERDVAQLAASGAKVNSAASATYTGGLEGTGLAGAVTTGDIDRAKATDQSTSTIASEYEDQKLSNVRKVIAKAMHASLSDMAQLTLNASFDATQIMEYRNTVKAKGESLGLGNITLNDMIVYAVAKTLQNHKECNAHYLGDQIRYFRDVNMGIAVDTDRGLLVPTVFGVNNMTLNELSGKAKDTIAKAKSGNISPDQLTGGTFTITNLGALGVESFTPVINPPQTCILGVCTIVDSVRARDGEISTYKSMGLSLTFDHRALDGAPAARLLNDICTALENFSMILGK